MGLFRKSEAQLLAEEKLLQRKIELQKAKVAKTKKLEEIRERVAARKSLLKGLKGYNNKNTALGQAFEKYKKVKAKTSPVIRKMEKKVVKNAPKILKKLGEAGTGISDGLTGSTMKAPKKKKKSAPPQNFRLW